jgi:hypothetical protein
MLLKHVLLTCQETNVNFIYGLYEIFYKPVYKKILSVQREFDSFIT